MTYICVADRVQMSQTCEGPFAANGVGLECPRDRRLKLVSLNYGRTQPYSEICDWPSGDGTQVNCYSGDAVRQIARETCDGHLTCRLTYNGLGLTDTCPGTYKYIEIEYKCLDRGKSDQTQPPSFLFSLEHKFDIFGVNCTIFTHNGKPSPYYVQREEIASCIRYITSATVESSRFWISSLKWYFNPGNEYMGFIY